MEPLDAGELLISVLNAVPFPVYVADVATYDLVFVNRALAKMLDVRGQGPCHAVLYAQERPCLHCRISALIGPDGMPNGASDVSELFNDVDERWYQPHEKCIVWPDGRVVKYSILVDISALKETQNALASAHADLALRTREVERLSVTDHLTQLFNRLHLDRVLEGELEQSRRTHRPFAVILADLDRFKLLNDVHGHQAGDRVLVTFAGLIRARLRRYDTAGRWGGEEFLAIVPGVDGEAAMAVAESLRAGLAGHDFGPLGQRTASFGVAVWQAGDSAESLVHRADQALYRAKELGRNRVVLEASETATIQPD